MNPLHTTNNPNQSVPNLDGTDKFINALKKLDDILTAKGHEHYQERIHRIAKTIRSIEAHSFCFVSDFSLEDNPLSGLQQFSNLSEQNFCNQLEYMTINEKGNTFEFNESGNKMNFEINDLLSFMESQLDMDGLIDNKAYEESSSDEEDTSHKTQSSGINNTRTINTQKEFRKRFFNIELKLRAFLKQQQQNKLIDKDNFSSFMDQLRLRTPLTKNPPKPTPSFIRNFFIESKEEIEKMKKKRMTMVYNKEQLANKLGPVDTEKFLIRSEMIKTFNAPTGQQEKQKISNFGIDDIPVEAGVKIRGSIFKSPFSYDNSGNYISETEAAPILDKDDIISEVSNGDDASEYEEVEEEVEIEVEEEEEVEANEKNKN